MNSQTTMGAAQLYQDAVHRVLARIVDTQSEALEEGARRIAATIERGGIVYALGSGHSLMVAAEMYYRAGGMANFDVIHDRTFGRAERLPGYAKILLDSYPISKNDLLIVVSNSGRNALPVEMALEAKAREIYCIGITSMAHSRQVLPRTPQGLRLFEACDLVIDNCGEPGDASVPLGPTQAARVGPTSTLAGIFIVNSMVAMAAEALAEKGIDPPVFLSANLDGADEKNARLFGFLRDRTRGL